MSILVLVFFIPATLGFALINHHCTGCQSYNMEATFLLTTHDHDDASCFCTESSATEESHDCDQQEDACHDENTPLQHAHDCDVELKKIEEPFTPASFDKWLPRPLDIAFAALFFVNNQIPAESFTEITSQRAFSPPRILTGSERLIMNEVFRL